jgi:hypothetical protein
MTTAELQAQAPGFPWAAFLSAAGVRNAQRVIVAQNTAIPKLSQIFAAQIWTRSGLASLSYGRRSGRHCCLSPSSMLNSSSATNSYKGSPSSGSVGSEVLA